MSIEYLQQNCRRLKVINYYLNSVKHIFNGSNSLLEVFVVFLADLVLSVDFSSQIISWEFPGLTAPGFQY